MYQEIFSSWYLVIVPSVKVRVSGPVVSVFLPCDRNQNYLYYLNSTDDTTTPQVGAELLPHLQSPCFSADEDVC